ncbi:hypothetical protein K1719_001472 [Acacia pycnantha]|nr:hypothetical protein K1719_001472 [Acacia pycnantha]
MFLSALLFPSFPTHKLKPERQRQRKGLINDVLLISASSNPSLKRKLLLKAFAYHPTCGHHIEARKVFDKMVLFLLCLAGK